jgi:hypothetical protein
MRRSVTREENTTTYERGQLGVSTSSHVSCMMHSAFANPEAIHKSTILLFPRNHREDTSPCIEHEGFEVNHSPSLQATRSRIGKHALRIASPDHRTSCQLWRQLQIGMWAPHGIRSRKLEHMTYSRSKRALISSPHGTGGEPIRRAHMKRTHTQMKNGVNRIGRRLIEASFLKRV